MSGSSRGPSPTFDGVGADTVIVLSIANPIMPIPEGVVRAIQDAAAGGARIVSICTGAAGRPAGHHPLAGRPGTGPALSEYSG